MRHLGEPVKASEQGKGLWRQFREKVVCVVNTLRKGEGTVVKAGLDPVWLGRLARHLHRLQVLLGKGDGRVLGWWRCRGSGFAVMACECYSRFVVVG